MEKNFQEAYVRPWSGLAWLGLVASGELFWIRQWVFASHKTQGVPVLLSKGYFLDKTSAHAHSYRQNYTRIWQKKKKGFNPLTPNDHYIGRTAPLTSKRCILYIYSTNIGTEYFKRGIYSPFFSFQNTVCFIILTYLVPVLFIFIYRAC